MLSNAKYICFFIIKLILFMHCWRYKSITKCLFFQYFWEIRRNKWKHDLINEIKLLFPSPNYSQRPTFEGWKQQKYRQSFYFHTLFHAIFICCNTWIASEYLSIEWKHFSIMCMSARDYFTRQVMLKNTVD